MNFLVYHWITSQKKVLLLKMWHLFLMVMIERLRQLKTEEAATYKVEMAREAEIDQ